MSHIESESCSNLPQPATLRCNTRFIRQYADAKASFDMPLGRTPSYRQVTAQVYRQGNAQYSPGHSPESL
jgi:hypothetical protein